MNKVISVGLSCVFATLAIGCSGDPSGESIEQIEQGANNGNHFGHLPFLLSSPNFEDGAPTPAPYTCAGNPFATGVSPELNWTKGPNDTKSYAIVFRDTSPPDVNFQYHWAIWNIPHSRHTLPEGIPGLIPGSTEVVPLPHSLKDAEHVQARGIARYFAPCPSNQTTLAARCGLPPVPPVTDTYTYTIYALTEKEITVFPHDPMIHANYVYRLDALFQSMTDAEHRAVLTTTSDAVPSTVPFPCPVPPQP
jgi:phosphatidylethanolamine-binding protein (PEBP) family uncharacterized protein